MILIRWGAFCAFAISLYAEFAEGYEPCALCLAQRVFWGLIFAGSLFKKAPKYVLSALLGITCLIASYQALIAFGLLEDRCLKEGSPVSLAEFRKHIETTLQTGCKTDWIIFSLPASFWSALQSGVLFLYGIFHTNKAAPEITNSLNST